MQGAQAHKAGGEGGGAGDEHHEVTVVAHEPERDAVEHQRADGLRVDAAVGRR